MAPLSGWAARMISSTNLLRPIRAKSASPPITPLPRGRSSSRNPQILRPQSCCSVIDAATRLPAAPAPIMSTFRVSPRAGPPYSLNFHLQAHKAATWSTPAITIKPLIVHGAPSRKYAAHNRNVAQKTDFPRMRLCLLKSEPPTCNPSTYPMSVINAACKTAMPRSERGAPAAYRKDQTRGKSSLNGTRAAPTINQFKDTRAQSAPIDLSHLDATGLCKG